MIETETLTPARKSALLIAVPLLGSFALAISAQVQVPLYPVPMTLQSLVVVMIGLLCSPISAAAAVALYLAEGALGAPVFSGWKSGPMALAGPTGGFLFGFLLAAPLVSLVRNRSDSWLRLVVAGAAGHAGLFAVGVSWLALSVGWQTAVAAGFSPFVFGTVLKIGIAAGLAKLWLARAARSSRNV